MSAILLNSHSHRRRSDHFLCALLDCSLKGRLRPHALQPLMVSQRSLRLHTWWWKDHNPGPPSGSASVQRRDRSFRNVLFYGESRRSLQGLGPVGNFDYMPSQAIAFPWEFDFGLRVSLIFLGRTESPLATQSRRDSLVSGFTPDLHRDENRLNKAIWSSLRGKDRKL